jgi:hypothetical protein
MNTAIPVRLCSPGVNIDCFIVNVAHLLRILFPFLVCWIWHYGQYDVGSPVSVHCHWNIHKFAHGNMSMLSFCCSMILAGDMIDTSLGVTLGISTMCAAAIGNIVSDVAGVMLGTVVEDFCSRYLNLPT